MAKINSKAKGNRGELECVKILISHLGEGFARVPSSGAWGGGQNRGLREDMSYEQKVTLVADIMTPPDFKFVLEHKYYEEASFWDLFNEKSKLYDWAKQVVGDAEFVGKEPMLICKYNRHQRIVFTKVEQPGFYFKWQGWYCSYFESLLGRTDRGFWFDV